MTPGRFLSLADGDPAWNMAVDHTLLHRGVGRILRFYGWNPAALSLGHFQSLDDVPVEVRSELRIVRRITGGGAIVHADELTYSLCLDSDDPILAARSRAESYAVLHAPIVRALARLGIPAHSRSHEATEGGSPFLCFARATSLDLVVDGKKLVGSAQRRLRSRFLQHGSILLSSHPRQPGTASCASALGRPVLAQDLAVRLFEEFIDLLGPLNPGELTPEESAVARAEMSRFSLP